MNDDKDFEVLKANVKTVMASPAGRQVIWVILSMCDLYNDSFTGDNRTFYNEGKRAVGLDILQLLEDADPNIYGNLLLTMNEDNDG